MRSGSLFSTAMTRKVACRCVISSPRLTCSRSSSVCSATAPQMPSSSQEHVCRSSAGESDDAPNNGQASSTAFSSTSWRSASCRLAGHRPWRASDGLRDAALRVQESMFVVAGARDAPDCTDDIAAQQRPALFGRPVRKASRQRLHAGDGRHAQHQAEEENAKAGKAAAHLAPREAQGERRVRLMRRRLVGHDPAVLQPHDALAAPRQAFLMRDQKQRRAALGIAARTADRRSLRRSRRRDCRSARRRTGLRSAARWRGPAPRAAARRPTTARDNDRRARSSPTARNSRSARSKASGTPISSSGTATFSSAVMVGIRWKIWNTMPTRPRRKRASASSPMRVMSVPAT